MPTELEVTKHRVFITQAGPTPHNPEDGKVVALRRGSDPVEIASGASMLIDVERGPGGKLYALSQGQWDGAGEGSPASQSTGRLVIVKRDDSLKPVLDRYGEEHETAEGRNPPRLCRPTHPTSLAPSISARTVAIDLPQGNVQNRSPDDDQHRLLRLIQRPRSDLGTDSGHSSPVTATRPAARPSLSLGQFGVRPVDAPLPGVVLLGGARSRPSHVDGVRQKHRVRRIGRRQHLQDRQSLTSGTAPVSRAAPDRQAKVAPRC